MNKLSLVLLAFLFTLGLSACEKGPAEKAGERMDDAMENVGDNIEEAGDEVEDKLDN